jgi:hypothetical protein
MARFLELVEHLPDVTVVLHHAVRINAEVDFMRRNIDFSNFISVRTGGFCEDI